jgi:integrase
VRRGNDVPRQVILVTLALQGLRIGELCARRRGPGLRRAQDLGATHAPHRRRPARPRQGDQDEAAERVLPMLPAAHELLAARGQRQIARCTPHTLRRTYASILAEANGSG